MLKNTMLELLADQPAVGVVVLAVRSHLVSDCLGSRSGSVDWDLSVVRDSHLCHRLYLHDSLRCDWLGFADPDHCPAVCHAGVRSSAVARC